MIHSTLRWADLKYLSEILGIEQTFNQKQFHEAFLEEAEARAALFLGDLQEPNSNWDYERLQKVISRFYFVNQRLKLTP